MNNFTSAGRERLAAAGYERIRSGKGDHEIWRHPETRVAVPVDSKIKSRHTANKIMKDSGLTKSF